ncbi:MAG TPA: hypothetical protein VNY09_03600 [Candidatus Sulfotelmatobacter sp.]|jgi:hypothetical protein|nr:hypothetical protein [Candidatus Sulfotelmatobacter sp.]
MKPETLEITTEDRLATGDEVRRAVSFSNERLLELCRRQGNYCHTDSDLGGIVRYPAEELEFFSYLSEADDSVIN